MPVKRTTYPHTGIFQRRVSEVALRIDEEGMRDLAELLPGGPQADPFGLDAMEAAVRAFIKEYAQTEIGGFDETLPPGSMEWLVQERVSQQREEVTAELRNVSRERERELKRRLVKIERVADACEVLSLIDDGMRPYLRTQSPDQTVMSMIGIAFLLGQAYGRFRARAHEEDALTGSKVLAAVTAGGKALRQKTATDYEKIVTDFRRSGLSQRRFLQLHPDIKRSTLQRAVRRLKKLASNPSK